MSGDGVERDGVNETPLAGYCSLCGCGYYPNLAITIADEPTDGEFRWGHDQCQRDHDRVFLEAFESGDLQPLNDGDGGER